MPRGTNFENRSQKSGEKLWRGATKAKVLPLSLRFLRFLFQDTRYMFELLARGYLSTPCKVDVPATLEHSLRVLGKGGREEEDGRSEVEVESSFARVLTSPTSSSFPPPPIPPIFHGSPSPSFCSGEEDSAANPRASRRRLQRERRKPYSYATLPPRC